jgi:hypothetical protein
MPIIMNRKQQNLGWVALGILLGCSFLSPAYGQEVGATVGYQKVFLDEPFHPAAGAWLRSYLTERFSLEPEFLYMHGSRFEEWMVVPNLTYDLSDPSKRVRAYLVGGIGLLHCRDKSIYYSLNEWTGQAGVGVRIFISERLFISPAILLGTHAFPRLTARLGYVFSGRRK